MNIKMNIEEIFSKNNIELKKEISLAQYSTIKIGGKAKYFTIATNSKELLKILNLAESNNVRYFVLGNGSNVIFSDKGFDGLIILNETSGYSITNETIQKKEFFAPPPRYSTEENNVFAGENSPGAKNVIVKVDSGMRLQKLMKKLFKQDVVGLEYFAGIPATVGGAVYMNIHGGAKYFSEFVHSALLFKKGKTRVVTAKYFEFEYDWSKLHETREVLIWVKLKLLKSEGALGESLAINWASQKSIQPRVSAGCVFKNINKKEKDRLNLPNYSAGFVIDKLLGLKGYKIGGAKISDKHAAFIENTGNAKAEDVLKLIEYVKEKAKNKLNLDLELEVELVGEF